MTFHGIYPKSYSTVISTVRGKSWYTNAFFHSKHLYLNFCIFFLQKLCYICLFSSKQPEKKKQILSHFWTSSILKKLPYTELPGNLKLLSISYGLVFICVVLLLKFQIARKYFIFRFSAWIPLTLCLLTRGFQTLSYHGALINFAR